nr:hypothetical protein [Kibdelosporangium sp. MJ126-NF4]CEL17638.1 hypothetical protein [Kibdelosporangium sp. MJ126-NF4]CTQ91134.1 hypothetical protein [Kibdelosporangium sp. MJ126-NF4]
MNNKDLELVSNKEILRSNKELMLGLVNRALLALAQNYRRMRATGDRGAQTVDMAVWIGLITILAIVILWPQVQELLQSLMSKFKS